MEGRTKPPAPGFTPAIRWVIWLFVSFSLVPYLIVVRLQAPAATAGETSGLDVAGIFLALGALLAFVSQGIRFVVSRVRSLDGRASLPAWADGAFVVALGLAESPAVFGLILGLQGEPPARYLPLFAISGAALLLLAPKWFYPRVGEEE